MFDTLFRVGSGVRSGPVPGGDAQLIRINNTEHTVVICFIVNSFFILQGQNLLPVKLH